ncbi:hypothetical protein ACFE04_012261 [Oxalis oulophora]
MRTSTAETNKDMLLELLGSRSALSSSWYSAIVASVGRGGGIACLWNPDVSVDVPSFYIEHINVVVDEECGLKELQTVGLVFTWKSNRRDGNESQGRGFKFEIFWAGYLMCSKSSLKALLCNPTIRSVTEDIKRMEKELKELLDMEDKMWRQRAKRKKNNWIKEIQLASGEWVTNQVELKHAVGSSLRKSLRRMGRHRAILY